MDDWLWTLIDIILPAALLVALIWVVLKRRSTGTSERTEEGTRQVYAEEEERRREGTDDL